MKPPLPRLRFRLSSLFILILGIAIGFSLNIYTLRLILGERSEAMMASLPTYVIEPPDTLWVEVYSETSEGDPVLATESLVGPDGRLQLGALGDLLVAGMTLEQAKAAIERRLTSVVSNPVAVVDVHRYNSKKYYVITQQTGGDTISQHPITGNDTVLDALAAAGGVPQGGVQAKLWISRPSSKPGGSAATLPVDYGKITQGQSSLNYQLLPGDRLFISLKPPAKGT
ncbi:MAG: polysaccharide biosynthesis/export family protein [Planctomycetales bacterium]|nr:polysaccharide biosynthesis/export family protein [Planctomycetales bacterium]